tara:strand:+ start:535 stop:1056 length:522 start_codon:yes stop_codon:yes gene_type:complete
MIDVKIKKTLTDMPNEILIMIFSYINDTNTYKNARLVCRLFQNILIDVKIFNQKKLYLNFRFNKYYNNNNEEEVTIMDYNNSEIGYIKAEYPMCARYYLKTDNNSTEYILNPNTVITKETKKDANINRTQIVVLNLKTKTHKRRTVTKIVSNNGPHINPFLAANIPPNGCIIF